MTHPADKPHKQGVSDKFPPADVEMFDRMDRQELYDYIFMQIKNTWRVDGLYFLGIERRHDTEEATEVDAECWRYMGKTEARELKKFLGIDEPDPAQVLWLLRHTNWAVSHPHKSFEVRGDGSAVFTVDACRTQLIRLDKGLEPHPCRQVREGYLQAFCSECNPKVALEVVCCPPERERTDIWCQWVFKWA